MLIVRFVLTSSLLLTTACHRIRVHTETPEHTARIEAAGRQLGVKVVVVPESGRGVVELEIKGSEGSICGTATDPVIHIESVRSVLETGIIDCTPKAWSCPNTTFIAHELGHLVGALQHVDKNDPEMTRNLMHPHPRQESELTEEQRLRMRAMSGAFSKVCR